MIKIIITSFLVFCLGTIQAQQPALSNRVANYNMDINLDTETKKLNCSTILTWTNPSADTISELYFHLYYNAFKNANSTFFKERGVPDWLTSDIDETCGWAYSHVSNFKDDAENDLSASLEYVQPDDNNPDDQTVLKVTLAKPVMPYQTQKFTFDWEAKIPKTMPRTGYNKDFFFFAQWFPKVGVYEPAGMRFAEEGQWNCHQYHSSGEYYSDFGNYEVKMNVPSNFIVASSGVNVGIEKKGERKIWHFSGHDIIDFTWTCSPHYIINEDNYKQTNIRLYTYSYKDHLKERYFPTIKFCMQFLDEHLGTYPYKTLSIVDPPIHGMFTGGMEYPTIITSLSFCFFPEGIKTPETLVVHEFIHQYFMQMVATHEVEETWMDEGITTYYEGRILDAYMGEHTSTIDVLGFKCGNKEFNRAEYFSSDSRKLAPNSAKSWHYKHGGYGDIAYNKTALWLQTLEGLLGVELMDALMKKYFQTWKFKHPSRNDFIAIFNEGVKEALPEKYPNGLDWFFQQVLFGTNECDYKVKSITNTESEAPRGFINNLDDCSAVAATLKKYNSQVIFQRDGEITVPQNLQIIFEDGSSQFFSWDGQERSFDVSVATDLKIVEARVDPEGIIMMDRNLINNYMTVQPVSGSVRKIVGKVLTKMQHLMESISLLI
ncbi:MAG: M1 family metallopeptidase [Saprospiraceae bacterium]|nr:M1 family metallopeptidase [Saprospiraceae bacterium]